MKPQASERWLFAASLANLILAREFAFLIGWAGESYFAPDIRPSTYLSIVLVWMLLTVLAHALSREAERGAGWRSAVARALICLAFLSILSTVRTLSQISVNYPFLSLRYFLGDWGRGNYAKAGLLALALGFAWYRWSRPIYRATDVFVRWSAPLLIFTLVKCTYYSATYVYRATPLPPPEVSETRATPPRILWMIFDEMGEHFVDEKRPAELRLPALDRLRAESLIGRAAYSPSDATVRSLPSLLSGRILYGVEPTGRYDLQMRACWPRETVYFGARPNFFSDLRERGMRTHFFGWYHPYCRVFGRIADDCLPLQGDRDYSGSVPSNMWRILKRTALGEPSHEFSHEVTYWEMRDDVQRSLARPIDPARGHIWFLHWPVPHLAAIRFDGAPSFPAHDENTTAYFNNLALADRTLGEVRERLEKEGRWDGMTVVLSSDHWWRGDPELARMGESARWERWRVPFLLKLPGQHEAIDYHRPFNTALTTALLTAITSGEISSPAHVAAWLEEHPLDNAPIFENESSPARCEARLPAGP